MCEFVCACVCMYVSVYVCMCVFGVPGGIHREELSTMELGFTGHPCVI